MGVSFPAGTIARTGAERATLVRRTYSLVFVSILFTVAGAMFALSQPSVLTAVAAHPWISMLATFAPLFLAMRARDAFPANIALVLLFTFAEGVFIAPILYVYGQQQPGLITQAAVMTILEAPPILRAISSQLSSFRRLALRILAVTSARFIGSSCVRASARKPCARGTLQDSYLSAGD